MFLFAALAHSQPAFADWTLTLDWHGPGSATVSDSRGGSFTCANNPNCTANYPDGTVVTLTPNPSGTSFWMWDGACSGFVPCQITMSGNRSVQAKFKYALRTGGSGGHIGISVDDYITIKCFLSGCTRFFPEGVSLVLTALANSSDRPFIGWDGACSGTGPCNVTMDADKNVQANFFTPTYLLSVTLDGTGTGTVKSTPIGIIDCPSTCSATVTPQDFSLTANPTSGDTFAGWGGDCTGTSPFCTVTITSAKNVTATFTHKASTSITLTPSPRTAGVRQAMKFTAKMSPSAPPSGKPPSGMVTFKEGSTTLGTGALSSFSEATFSTTALTIGLHTITAVYPGDANFSGSTVSTVVAVNPKVGPEFRANTFTAGAQQFPAIARLKAGYITVWASNGQDGNGYGVYGQRYSSIAGKQLSELHINVTTAGNQSMPKVAGLTAGGFVVVWQSDKQDGNTSGIYARAYSAIGTATTSEFKVNTTVKGAQTQPTVAPLNAGGFVVAWTSDGQDGAGLGVYAQLYDAHSKPVGGEFKVNTKTAGAQSMPAAAGLTGGGYVVVWQGPDANGLGVFGQLYDAKGKAIGKEIALNKITAKDQSLPSVAGTSDGGFVAAWLSQDSTRPTIFARRFTAAGAAIGNESAVNLVTSSDLSQPSVSAFADGGFVVLWTSLLWDGAGKGVFAQVYKATGVRYDNEFNVNTTTAGDQWQPAVAAATAGAFMAAWTSRSSSPTPEDVFVQFLKVP